LKSSSYEYFNFKYVFLGSKNGKIVVFIVKILKVKNYCQKLNVRNEQMVVLPSKNPPSGQKFKMLYFKNDTAFKMLYLYFAIIIIFQCLSHM